MSDWIDRVISTRHAGLVDVLAGYGGIEVRLSAPTHQLGMVLHEVVLTWRDMPVHSIHVRDMGLSGGPLPFPLVSADC